MYYVKFNFFNIFQKLLFIYYERIVNVCDSKIEGVKKYFYFILAIMELRCSCKSLIETGSG